MELRNKLGKAELREQLMNEDFRRITLSFYKYVRIADPKAERDRMFADFTEIQVLGRIYLAHEGINAQISVPEYQFDALRNYIDSDPKYSGVPFKIAVEDDGKSFYKLTIKIKTKIVGDGLKDDAFNVSDVGKHLTASEFNDAMEQPGTLVVDMRNHYESEVGHFENALLPDADTFRQALPQSLDLLKGKEKNKILLYCTGGIRCEKASSYLKHHGFEDVNQLYGGIIAYAHEIKEKKLPNRFLGKNFVFDSRMGERIGEEIISRCHQCGNPSDHHVNCANDDCHLLFIQCSACEKEYEGCCTPECLDIIHLPIDEQIRRRKGKVKDNAHSVYKSRLRPKLSEHFVKRK